MRNAFLGFALLLGASTAALAQTGSGGGSLNPDSTMAPGAGNNSGASNGAGTAGSLTGNAGSHSSTVQGMGNTAAIGDKASRPDSSGRGDAKVESDPTQGGGKQNK